MRRNDENRTEGLEETDVGVRLRELKRPKGISFHDTVATSNAATSRTFITFHPCTSYQLENH